MPKKHYCDCKAMCKGELKQVSSTTFFAHRPYRDENSRFSARLQDVFNSNPVIYGSSSNALEGSGSSSGAIVPSNATSNPVPQAEQTHGSVDDSSHQNIAVRVSPAGASDPAPNEVSPSESVDSLMRDRADIELILSDPLVNDDFPGGLADSPTPNASETRSGNIEDLWLQQPIYLDELKTSASFIRALQDITLDDPMLSLSDEVLERLRNPLRDNPSLSIDDDTRLAIRMFMDTPSEEAYEKNRRSILLHPRMADASLPSYYRMKRLVADLTGIESVVHHMCINSCLAYTGPFSELEICPLCSEPRYDQFKLQSSGGSAKIPRQEFHTIPIGPQLQALY